MPGDDCFCLYLQCIDIHDIHSFIVVFLSKAINFLQSNTFDFGPAGCRECECNPLGSASLQCSSSGQCLCQANVTGLKCTQCTLGFYGLPLMSCRGKKR